MQDGLKLEKQAGKLSYNLGLRGGLVHGSEKSKEET